MKKRKKKKIPLAGLRQRSLSRCSKRENRGPIFLPSKEQKLFAKKDFCGRTRERDTSILEDTGAHYDRWNTVLRVLPPKQASHPRNRRTCHSFSSSIRDLFRTLESESHNLSSNGIVSLRYPPSSSFSYFYILSLSLSLCRANLTTRGALVTSLISRENRQAYIHDGRALIGYPASGREQPPSKKGRRSSLRRLPDSRDLTLPDRRLLFHGGGSGGFRFERAINRWTGVKLSGDDLARNK